MQVCVLSVVCLWIRRLSFRGGKSAEVARDVAERKRSTAGGGCFAWRGG